MASAIVHLNRKQDIYLKDSESNNCIFIPKNWCDEFDDEFAKDDGPNIMCWGPEEYTDNSPIDTLWFPIDRLEKCDIITKEEAMRLHPKMFETFANL